MLQEQVNHSTELCLEISEYLRKQPQSHKNQEEILHYFKKLLD